METENRFEASLSSLIVSIAESAAMNLGLVPNLNSGELERNPHLARFHIDLLIILKEKTSNNLTSDEQKLLDKILNDLQLQFVEMNKQKGSAK